MSSLASRAPEAVQRRRRELRAVKLLLAGLAVVTALVSFALFSAASFTLLVLPFVVFVVVCCAFVLPMDGFDRHAAESSANLLLQRRAEAERHAFVPPVSSAESAVQLSAANLSQTQTAMAAAEAHGIRFACAHLSDGDFLIALLRASCVPKTFAMAITCDLPGLPWSDCPLTWPRKVSRRTYEHSCVASAVQMLSSMQRTPTVGCEC